MKIPSASRLLLLTGFLSFVVPELACAFQNVQTAGRDDLTITGTVTDSIGTTLRGVTVSEKGTTNSVATNQNGRYTINVKSSEAILVFSLVGYADREIQVARETVINAVLSTRDNQLEDIVVVGYGTQKRTLVTGSVSTVQSKDITVAPVGSTINTLAGRIPGLISKQESGRPGADQAALSIRGFGQAIWIVDGVESNFNNIDPNQIESISILKDGAAAIYGARAGNGVVLVTTKQGLVGKTDITLNSAYTLQGNTIMVEPVSSGQYAELQNRFFQSQGRPLPYTEEDIQKYYDGTDPGYPNTNWRKVAMKNWAPQHNQNVSVRGGSDKIKYFGFIGYMDQQSIWRNNGGGYKRYNLQSNIDAKISDDFSVQLLLSGVHDGRSESARGAGINGGVFGDLWASLPIYPATLPDPTKHSYAVAQGVGSALLATDEEIFGYSRNNAENVKATFIADYKIRAVEGLSLKAFINYDKTYITNKHFLKAYSFYTYDPASEQYTLIGSKGSTAKLDYSNQQNRNITTQFSINYNRRFNNDHYVNALLLNEMIDYRTNVVLAGRDNFLTQSIEELFAGSVATVTANSSATQMGRASYLGRVNYSYKEKYIADVALRADASAKFAEGSRWGYFPSTSLSWRIDQEDFFQQLKAVDELKLRASYGRSGLDNVGDFRFLTGYQLGGQWLIGDTPGPGIATTGLANPNLTWQNVAISNLGVDFSLYNRKLYGTAEVFYRKLTRIPATRLTTLPNTFGAVLPEENLNSMSNRGFDFSLGTVGNIGELNYDISGNLSWSRAKWIHYEEPEYTDPDQIRLYQLSGQWADRRIGYRADGLFTSQEEIDNLAFTYPQGNDGLRPGDIKYIDVNGDGKLDFRDQEVIGAGTTPNWMAGLTINLRYKNFDLQTLFQGAFNHYAYILTGRTDVNYSVAFYNTLWTEENNRADAYTPRIGGASSNSLFSDHFYRKINYLRLKTLAIGYTLPQTISERARIRNLRVFLAGTNLFTVSPLNEFFMDPEAPSSFGVGYHYPQQRTITLGLNLTL
ncbi:SusC/RagA family TonB-linked outer membrane protein [Sphingobacterium corticis]|uniref:SusC/RagA family TonB-linked outer membrane protein n=1 Tax=Sphingobacterium corticis TaxID=1812823 RepID=A0ABW5NL90_9SPHI